MFPIIPPENTKNLSFSCFFRRYEIEALTEIGQYFTSNFASLSVIKKLI